MVWLHGTSLYQHFPFHRKSRVVCQQLCLARTLKSARSSCMSCWNMQLWGDATMQHSPGTSTAAISLVWCSPELWKHSQKEYWPCWVWSTCHGVSIMAAWIVQIKILLDLARKQNSSSGRNPTIPALCFVQFWKTKLLLWSWRSSTHWATKYPVKVLMHFVLDIIETVLECSRAF